MNANSENARIRSDLHQHLGGVRITEITEFSVRIGRAVGSAEVVCGGFGQPHVLITISSPAAMELALIECDGDEYDGEQDGSAPLQAIGWKWREWQRDNMLSAGWSSETFTTAEESLAAAQAAIVTE